MFSALDKASLRAELLASLTQTLEAARAAHAAALEGATHTEARAENDKDTRGLEQSYLARGQAQRVAELELGVAHIEAMALRVFTSRDAIASGALIAVDEDGKRTHYFMAPAGGGSVIGGDIQVITPASPVGRALAGKRVEDVVELKIGAKTRELEIVELR
jgi:transcription elongation GreA/GreB family factor